MHRVPNTDIVRVIISATMISPFRTLFFSKIVDEVAELKDMVYACVVVSDTHPSSVICRSVFTSRQDLQ